MYEDEFVKTAAKYVESRHPWKGIVIDILYAVNLILVGVVAGIALCKFWPGFWWFVNWGCGM